LDGLGTVSSGIGRVSWDTSSAVLLNTQVVSVHLHAEEASFSPVGAPRVTTDPELLPESGHTVADNGDFVVDKHEIKVLGVDTASVCVEFGSGVDTTRDRTVLSEVGLHLISTGQVVILIDVVFVVGHSVTAVETVVTNWGWRPGAVTALVNWLNSSLQVISNVLHAGRIRNTIVEGVLVDSARVTTVARATSVSIDNDLCVESNRSGVFQVKVDVKSISKS